MLVFDAGDWARAAKYVEAALAQRPAVGEYLHLLGRIKFAQGDLESALRTR